MSGGQIITNLLVKGEQTHGIALKVEKVAERRGQRRGVLGFRVAARAVGHRAAVIHQQVTTKVGLILKLLDEVTVTAREDPPVEITRVISRRVLAVFGEFNRKPVIRTAMDAVPKTLNYDPRAHFEV